LESIGLKFIKGCKEVLELRAPNSEIRNKHYTSTFHMTNQLL
jgi:hypothetical protein